MWTETYQNTETIIPAQPGWALVFPHLDDDGRPKGLFREPIIAWLIDRKSGICPATFYGVEEYDAFQRPDGCITILEIGDFEAEKDVMAFFQKRYEEGTLENWAQR